MANTLTDFTLCLEDEDGAAQTIDSFRVQVFDIDRDDDGFDEVRCASRGLLCLRRPSRSAPCPPISRLPPSVHTPATPHLTSHLPPATHTAHTPRLCHTHAPTLLHPHPQIVRIKVDEGGAFFPLSGSSTDTYLESATGTTDDGYDFASRRSGDQVLLPLPLPSLQVPMPLPCRCSFPVGAYTPTLPSGDQVVGTNSDNPADPITLSAFQQRSSVEIQFASRRCARMCT